MIFPQLCKYCTILLKRPHSLPSSTNKFFDLKMFSTSQRFSKPAGPEGAERLRKMRSTVNYLTAAGLLALGLSYAAVPLYRIFCAAYSYGGTTGVDDGGKIEGLQKVKTRPIKVRFNSDTGASMVWKFKPLQNSITVYPGETALAFYTATNPTDRAITGVSTYNVVPFEAGQYFNKIQCFCFEEQQLNPHEQVDMPVFFYIDPEYAEDPFLELVDEIILSYTFFEAREGIKIPVPSYFKKKEE